MEETLKEYYLKMNKDNVNAKNKYYHSIRVAYFCKSIAESLKLNENDILLSYKLGLLHDIGRFKQLKMFNNFSDNNIDHALLGTKELFEENEAEKYNIQSKDYQLLKKAIYYHSKYSIPNNLTKRRLIFSQIIRDADKLDILEEIINKIIIIKETEEEISEKVKKDFFDKKTIHKENIKNNNDVIIVYLAFLNDINFEWSKNYIKNNKILTRFYSTLKNKERFKDYIEFLKERGY